MQEEILINKNLKKKINSKTFWITGPGRSGTSIIGKLFASFNNAEYFYEPDVFLTLLSLRKKLKKNHFKLIFDTYFYFELIKNSLNKRRVNLNSNDAGSYFLNYKTKKELKNKFKFNIFKKQKNFKKYFVIKLPGYLDQIHSINKEKKFKIFYVDRNPLDTIYSIYKKKWWSKNLAGNILLIKHKNRYYPDWLNKKDYSEWNKSNEFERSAMYLIKLKKSLKKRKNVKILDYDNLVKNPYLFIKKIKKMTGMSPSKKTFELVKTIKKSHNIDLNWIKKKLNSKLLKMLFE